VPARFLAAEITIELRGRARDHDKAFVDAELSCASVRATTSVPPPGGNGTTILMIRSGYPANARVVQAADSSANAASANKTFVLRFRRSDILNAITRERVFMP